MKKIVFAGLFTLLLGAVFIPNSQATLIGDDVHIAQNYDKFGTELKARNRTVSDSVEYYNLFHYNINIGADYIAIDFNYDIDFYEVDDNITEPFNGPVITGLNDSSGKPLSGFTLDTNHPDFNATNVSFGDDWIGFNLEGFTFDENHTITAYLEFEGEPSPVPEPATLILLGFGLAGLAGASRKRLKK